ncbi:MAG: site-specific integrase [Gammaproteobacteria bacterium]|nr:MAG: site-specific integrase [Gammaproteobacteria bacterium]
MLDAGVVPDWIASHQAQEGGLGSGLDGVPRPRTLAELIETYLDHHDVSQAYAPLLRLIAREHGDLHLAELNYAWVDDWIRDLKRRRNLAPGTIRKRKGALQAAVAWTMVRWPEAIPVNPLEQLPTGYSRYSEADRRAAGTAKHDLERDRRLEPGERERILASIRGEIPSPPGQQRPLRLHYPAAVEAYFELLVGSAMRLREAYTLTLSQVDIDRRTIRLDRTKNGDRRDVPLFSEVAEALRRYLATVQSEEGGMRGWRHPGERLFPFWDGSHDPLALERTTSRVSRLLRRVFAHAGCEDLRAHDLRHEATCQLYLRTQLSDLQIAKITGHRDLRMLRRYASLRGSELADLLP